MKKRAGSPPTKPKVKTMISEFEEAANVMTGKKITSIHGLKNGSESVDINTEDGFMISFYHNQDCCELFMLEDFEDDIYDHKDAVILSLSEVKSRDEEELLEGSDICHDVSSTWTFYKIETSKGGLWLRFCGTSNGYYSEEAEVIVIEKENKDHGA